VAGPAWRLVPHRVRRRLCWPEWRWLGVRGAAQPPSCPSGSWRLHLHLGDRRSVHVGGASPPDRGVRTTSPTRTV